MRTFEEDFKDRSEKGVDFLLDHTEGRLNTIVPFGGLTEQMKEMVIVAAIFEPSPYFAEVMAVFNHLPPAFKLSCAGREYLPHCTIAQFHWPTGFTADAKMALQLVANRLVAKELSFTGLVTTVPAAEVIALGPIPEDLKQARLKLDEVALAWGAVAAKTPHVLQYATLCRQLPNDIELSLGHRRDFVQAVVMVNRWLQESLLQVEVKIFVGTTHELLSLSPDGLVTAAA